MGVDVCGCFGVVLVCFCGDRVFIIGDGLLCVGMFVCVLWLCCWCYYCFGIGVILILDVFEDMVFDVVLLVWVFLCCCYFVWWYFRCLVGDDDVNGGCGGYRFCVVGCNLVLCYR